MTKINHGEILQTAIEMYKLKYGNAGFAKADVEDMVYKIGGTKEDVYEIMALGMERFFNGVKNSSSYLN